MEWSGTTSGTLNTTTIRTGTYSGECTAAKLAAGTPIGWAFQFASAVANGPYYARFYFNIHTAPGTAHYIFEFSSSALVSSVGSGCIIRLNTDRTLSLLGNDLVVAGSSSALTLDTWYRVEVLIDNTATTITALLDGTQFATATSATKTAAVLALKIGGNLDNNINTTGDWFFDDVALNDSTGASQTSYPGAGSIIQQVPAGAGDSTGWTIAGSAAAATNWQSVNEVPPDDGVTFVKSLTLNQEDFYTMTASGIGASDTVNVVMVMCRLTGSVSSADSLFKTEIKKVTGGTISSGTALTAIGSTTWSTNTIAVPRLSRQVLYSDPDSVAWTKATLDTMQAGIKITSANTNFGQVSALYVSVDYTPSVINTSQFMPFFRP